MSQVAQLTPNPAHDAPISPQWDKGHLTQSLLYHEVVTSRAMYWLQHPRSAGTRDTARSRPVTRDGTADRGCVSLAQGQGPRDSSC